MQYLACFTDGAAKKNSKTSEAGWAFYIPILKFKKSGHMIGTNNAAELTAIKELFEHVLTLDQIPKIIVYSDSKYAIGVLTGMKIKANQELVFKILDLANEIWKRSQYKVEMIHVDAHTKKTDWLSECNDIVDKLASKACNRKD